MKDFMENQKFQKGDMVTIMNFPKMATVVEYIIRKSSTTKFVIIKWQDEDEIIQSLIPEDALKKVK